MLCHRLLLQGWQKLFASGAANGAHEPAVADSKAFDDAGIDEGSFQRKARVRARKAGLWISDAARMISDLTLAVVCLGPNEHYLFQQMKLQSLGAWTGKFGLQALALLSLVQLHKSPAVSMLEAYHDMMVHRPIEDTLALLAGILA